MKEPLNKQKSSETSTFTTVQGFNFLFPSKRDFEAFW